MASSEESALPAGLYIIATPIGNMGDITLRAIDVLRAADIIACEDTREAGKLASAYDIKTPRMPYHDHNAAEMRPKIAGMIAAGKAVALISDAGMPLVSDPGYKLVRECVGAGHAVTCVPGASASLAALVLSGLPSDRFLFAGFLPPKSAARREALAALAAVPATLIFYETAPRLAESLADMQAALGDRPAAVARELTKKFEEVRRETLSALALHYAQAGEPKGEIVVVVGAPDAASAGVRATGEEIDALLEKAMTEEGLRVRDAAAYVAAQTGWRRNEVYQRALLLRGRAED
jgi:16S rRNA (cytidine1402-2'-O)-methyltransferase